MKVTKTFMSSKKKELVGKKYTIEVNLPEDIAKLTNEEATEVLNELVEKYSTSVVLSMSVQKLVIRYQSIIKTFMEGKPDASIEDLQKHVDEYNFTVPRPTAKKTDEETTDAILEKLLNEGGEEAAQKYFQERLAALREKKDAKQNEQSDDDLGTEPETDSNLITDEDQLMVDHGLDEVL